MNVYLLFYRLNKIISEESESQTFKIQTTICDYKIENGKT